MTVLQALARGRRPEGLRGREEHPHPAEGRRHRASRRFRSTTRTRSRASGQRRCSCSPATRSWCPTRAEELMMRTLTTSSIAAALVMAATLAYRPAGRPASVRGAAAGRLERHAAAHHRRGVRRQRAGRGRGRRAPVGPEHRRSTRAAASTTSASAGRCQGLVFRLVQLYRDFRSLNSYDQSLNVSGRRASCRRTCCCSRSSRIRRRRPLNCRHCRAYRSRASAPASPTCAAASKRRRSKQLSIAASYNFEWIDFDKDPVLGRLAARRPLERRRSRRQVPDHGDARRSRPTTTSSSPHVVDGNQFNVQNGGPAQTIGCPRTRTSTARSGISRLYAADIGRRRDHRQSWRAGYGRHFEIGWRST